MRYKLHQPSDVTKSGVHLLAAELPLTRRGPVTEYSLLSSSSASDIALPSVRDELPPYFNVKVKLSMGGCVVNWDG